MWNEQLSRGSPSIEDLKQYRTLLFFKPFWENAIIIIIIINNFVSNTITLTIFSDSVIIWILCGLCPHPRSQFRSTKNYVMFTQNLRIMHAKDIDKKDKQSRFRSEYWFPPPPKKHPTKSMTGPMGHFRNQKKTNFLNRHISRRVIV